MKTAATVATMIRSEHSIKALPRLKAEWNMNRYYTTRVLNDPAEEEAGNDVDLFPIESIVEPNRPTKGINKARINYATVSDDYQSTSQPRFYVASDEDKYRYWISPYASDNFGNITGVLPTVLYEEMVNTNKIVVTVENSWASPSTWSIQYTTNSGGSWQTASSSPVLGADGRAVLYWTGSNWTSSKPEDMSNMTQINGVRVVVTKLSGGIGLDGTPTMARLSNGAMATTSGAGSYFSLIEISARLELDLTDRLVNVSDVFDAGQASHVAPVGIITSNTADLTLWNGEEDAMFSTENNSSILSGLIEPNVEMNLEYVYYDDSDTEYPVQQFKMFVDSWADGGDSTVKVSLSDASKYLKETSPLAAKYENCTLSQLVFRLCDSIGFNAYDTSTGSSVIDYRIPVFYTDGSKTAWELFNDLAIATQSVIYFDAWGVLQVRTRESAYDPSKSIDWHLSSSPRFDNSGNVKSLTDIVSLQQTDEYEANVIKVQYKSAEWAKENNGHVEFSTVWTPEDTVVLRSTPLVAPLGIDDQWIQISPGQAPHWPYSGAIQIEGEFIGYDAKWFNYRFNGQWGSVWVKDADEFDYYNKMAPVSERWMNNFNGRLRIDGRGLWNTEPVPHVIDVSGWSPKRYNAASKNAWWHPHGWSHYSQQSLVRLSDDGHLADLNQYLIVTRGATTDTGWRHFGARFRFNGQAPHQRGGIVINAAGPGDGYYIELRPTNSIENKDRDAEDEVSLYFIHAGNREKVKTGNKAPDLIVADTWHNLDVYYQWSNSRISVWIDGKKVLTEVVPGNAYLPPGGKFGMFIRGKTSMDFEYIYAVARDVAELPDDASFLNRVEGAYVGESWQREWVYDQRKRGRRWRKKNKKKNPKYRKNLQLMDEFGPYVHEVREFDVSFDPAPVSHSKLYFTNDWQVVCPEYRADAFGAYFILANASRDNAVVQGDDSLSFAAAGASISQSLLVYGRALVIGEQEEVEVRNEDQIRARGEIVSEINSEWVQSKEAATAVANWISSHWARGADELSVKVFGNPLFEIGDLVSINMPEAHMTPATHQYFVVGIRTSFATGIDTELTLRRKN